MARRAQAPHEILNGRGPWNRYPIWPFTDHTDNPMRSPGGILTQGLLCVVQELAHESQDDALPNRAVSGHSHGGPPTRMAAIESGDRLWDRVFNVSIDRTDVSPEWRAIMCAAAVILKTRRPVLFR